MALRRSEGYIRYALAVQYHGPTSLGVVYQGKQGENCILPDGTDLRGVRSVEGRLREALGALVGTENYENIQVSSRTDRGVHALKNTLHVDIRPRRRETEHWEPTSLVNGLNYYLVNQGSYNQATNDEENRRHRKRRRKPLLNILTGMQELRVVNGVKAPDTMDNPFSPGDDVNNQQPSIVDWNARFSATQRAYVYRILQSPNWNYGIPFEWDRSWRLPHQKDPLDIVAMQEAGRFLMGTWDFSSFRGADCQRASPFATMNQVSVHSQLYGAPGGDLGGGGLLGMGIVEDAAEENRASLVTIRIVGKSFLYRQVRNMVACLVDVGRGRMPPAQVKVILDNGDRSKNPAAMAPAHGLFLVDVKHGDFVI